MTDRAPLLKVEKLSFAYKRGSQRVPILQDLDFEILEGDFVGITGPSGSGKSTLFYLLGCLLGPTAGRIQFEGRELSKMRGLELAEFRNRKIGFVFQQFHLLPRASVLENILLPAHYPSETSTVTAEDRAKATHLAERLGLSDLLDRSPQELSGGQQQRVAVARALVRDAKLILADEPTGNLDTKSAAATLELLRELHREGKTVVIITHDREIAESCPKRLHLRDGRLERIETGGEAARAAEARHAARILETADISRREAFQEMGRWRRQWHLARALWRPAVDNLLRNKMKSFLTMIGVVIGIAAVLGMLTLGSFVKRKILEGYEALGVNAMVIQGYPNSRVKATDRNEVVFRDFDWTRDFEPLARIFPQIEMMSPLYTAWNTTVSFAGRTITDNVRTLGVNDRYPYITDRALESGRQLSPLDVENRAGVCTIGARIARDLFMGVQPLGQIIMVSVRTDSSFPCRVVGIHTSVTSAQEWWQPDLHVLVPFTYMRVMSSGWDAELHAGSLKIRMGEDVASTGQQIKGFFEKRYGSTGEFWVDGNSKLVAQMKMFLNLFSVLLASIAFISLAVGGIGINNMMLVAITERLKEIGLRKALGATNRSLRTQVLMESLVLCSLAGLIGALLGFGVYEGLIFGASKLIPKVQFEWVFEPGALALSIGAIFAVGILSGLAPSVKAERLEVIEALRSE